MQFGNELIAQVGLSLIVRQVVERLHKQGLIDPAGKFPSRNALQSYTLLAAIRSSDLMPVYDAVGGRVYARDFAAVFKFIYDLIPIEIAKSLVYLSFTLSVTG